MVRMTSLIQGVIPWALSWDYLADIIIALEKSTLMGHDIVHYMTRAFPKKKREHSIARLDYWRVTSFWSHLQANLRDAAAQAEMKAPRMCFHLIATTHLVMLQLMVKHSHKGGNWDILPQYLASCPTMATGWEQPAASRYTVFKCYAVAPVTDPFLPFKAT